VVGEVSAATGRATREAALEARTAWLFAAPGALLLGLFMLVPFALALALSFTDQRLVPNENVPTAFVGLRNYLRLLEDDTFRRALGNNAVFVLVVVPVQSALALGLAMLVNQRLRGVNLFRTIFFTPVATIMAVVAVVWSLLYSPGDGFVNVVLRAISFGGIPAQDWLGDRHLVLPAIMALSVWQGVGFQMLIFLAGLQGIPHELYEAADIDGAGPWRRFWNVTMPQLRNTTIFVVVTTTIYAFQLFDQVQIISRSGATAPLDAFRTMVLTLVETGFREQQVGYASAISVVFFAIVLAISLVQRVLLREDRVVR
jgi:multiple sugar transport system permease protein